MQKSLPAPLSMAQIMLSGFVFFSHQLGSFLYDRSGSYGIVWYLSIALGVFSALINLPVREAPLRAAAAVY